MRNHGRNDIVSQNFVVYLLAEYLLVLLYIWNVVCSSCVVFWLLICNFAKSEQGMKGPR